jgi:TonB family protein
MREEMNGCAKGKARSARLFPVCVLLLFLLVAAAGRAEQRAVKQRVAPVYPEVAKRLRVSGSVKLEVTIDADGKVKDVKTLSGNRMLSTAAEEAVYKWKFVPGSADSTEDVDISFELNQ